MDMLRCPICSSSIESGLPCFTAGFACPDCGGGLKFPSKYLVSLRITRVVLAGLIAYGLGLRGEFLIWAAFVLPLPLDIFNATHLSLSIRVSLSALIAYFLRLRGIVFWVGTLLGSIPVEFLFRALYIWFPPSRFDAFNSPVCPECGAAISYNALYSSDFCSCNTCHQQLRISKSFRLDNRWNVLRTTAGLLFLTCLLYMRHSGLRDIVLIIALLNADLPEALFEPPVLEKDRQRFPSLDLAPRK